VAMFLSCRQIDFQRKRFEFLVRSWRLRTRGAGNDLIESLLYGALRF
jgi:hypothetical protein